MKLIIEDDKLVIMPERAIDRAYIRNTLGLNVEGESIRLVKKGTDHAEFCLEAKK